MARFTNQKIEELLQQGKTAIGNTLATPEIQAQFDKYGYTADGEMANGQTLLQALDDKNSDRKRLYALQQEATADFNGELAQVKRRYARHAKITSAVLADTPELLGRLGLQGSRAGKFVEWHAQAQQFYREALAGSDLQTALAEGGLTVAVLQSGLGALDQVVATEQQQESAKGEAQQATPDRDAAATVFRDWMNKFWKIADVALADQPQWLERLGKKVKS